MTRLHARTAIAAALVSALSATSQAQLIDQFDVRREGDDAVLQLRFATEVQFQRAITARAGDLTIISYTVLTAIDPRGRAEQALRLGPREGLPRMSLADEADRGERNRRLVLRTAQAMAIDVRAGEGNRSIEIVLRGLGAGVDRAGARAPTPTVPTTPATLPTAERRFAIVIGSSNDPATPLPAPVPRSLQDYEVFTRERVVDGARRFETLIGHFSNRTQAEAVRRQLAAFPAAAVVATVAEPSPGAAASAPPTEAAAAATRPVAPAPSPAPAPEPAGAAVAEVAPPAPADIDARADALLGSARAAMSQSDFGTAIAALNELLNLPPNRHTAAAQELIARARATSGDTARARIEFETYLQLYPTGEGSERVRRELAALAAAPAPAAAAPAAAARPAVETTTTGSASMTYFGGNGQVRSQEFKDSPIAGLPQVAGDPLLAADKARQVFNDVDLSWRQRSADSDLRFVFRDAYTTDLERPDKSRNRLSALYVDYKSRPGGYGVRLGRQSPTGGGVMGRFDGVSAHLSLAPRLKLGAVAGQPSDRFFDSRRRFYGASIDADGLVSGAGAALYAIEQRIDAAIDRRALGLELRYFKAGASLFSQFDYDVLIKGLNIATVQGTLILEDDTVFNALYDRRALTLLALGNALTFEDPAHPGVLFTRIGDKLATTTLELLRQQIKGTTPYVTQAQLGITKPVDKTWQLGASAQLTSTGAIPPVPGVVGFEAGRAATGNIVSASAQLIGLNLYSPRDTHVWALTGIRSPMLDGVLVAYNNSSIAWNVWQFEPSLQYYRDRNPQGSISERWTPGLRLTYRGWERWALESSLTYEVGRASRTAPDPTDAALTITTREHATRVNYALGARYSF